MAMGLVIDSGWRIMVLSVPYDDWGRIAAAVTTGQVNRKVGLPSQVKTQGFRRHAQEHTGDGR